MIDNYSSFWLNVSARSNCLSPEPGIQWNGRRAATALHVHVIGVQIGSTIIAIRVHYFLETL